MDESYIGRAVSIECVEKLGIFQGLIKETTETDITLIRAFRNGVPMRKQDAEITLQCADIRKISFIPTYEGQNTLPPTVINKPTPVKQPNFTAPHFLRPWSGSKDGHNENASIPAAMANLKLSSNEIKSSPSSSRASSVQQQAKNVIDKQTESPVFCNNNVAKFFGNLIPPKVEARTVGVLNSNSYISPNIVNDNVNGVIDGSPLRIDKGREANNISLQGSSTNTNGNGNGNGSQQSKVRGASGNNGFGNTKKLSRKQLRRENSIKEDQTFGDALDETVLHEDFDFEGNLALFDKKAVWNNIEAAQDPKPKAPAQCKVEKYRHDENILESEPASLRQIETIFESSSEFVTDEGLIIPTIPLYVRSKIELTANKAGLSIQRQIDILARGATDLAIMLIGGARRLTPNNCHQWPKIVILCEKSPFYRSSIIGVSVGRQLAAHGLKVVLYTEEDPTFEKKNSEIFLFRATDNEIVYSTRDLPNPDLVIISSITVNLSEDVKKWLNASRASVFAIDPPIKGIHDVRIKYSILPILPLNGISSTYCGKLYLCNLGIPNLFYRNAGVEYKSPFGHKFVIPIHSKD